MTLSSEPALCSQESEFLRRYLDLGLSVIPILYGDKRPAVKWEEYQSRKPTEAEIATFFGDRDPKNMAVVCGEVSGGLVILDFDDEHAYSRFFPENSRLEASTPVVKTFRGRHVWLRTTEATRSFNIPELKLNLLAEGKYALIPPSLHPNGVAYEFVNGIREPMLVDNLVETLKNRCKELGVELSFTQSQGTIEKTVDVKPWRRFPIEVQGYFEGVPEGQREVRAFAIACMLLNEWRLPRDTVLEWLKKWNLQNNTPLELPELEHAIASALQGGYVFGRNSLQANLDAPALLGDPNLWNIVDGELGVTVREDPIGRQTAFLVELSAFQPRPANLLLLAGSATGKTWMAMQSALLLPPENVVIIGSATQRAWFYCGTPIYKEHPTEKGRKILSHYEIDWQYKVVIILDNVDERTIKDLKPVMSHDNPAGTIDIHATMKTPGGKLKTVQVKIHGSPAFINCSTRLRWNEELSTRHFFLTPRDDKAKYEAAALLILEREVSGEEPIPARKEEIRTAVRYLRSQNLKVKVKREVAEALKARFSWRSGRDTRDFERALMFLESCCWFHALQRERDASGAVLADERDLKIVEPLLGKVLTASRYATSGQVIEFHQRVLVPLSTSHNGGAFGRDEAMQKHNAVYGRPIRYSTLHEMVETLEDIGLIDTEPDPSDKRKRLIRVRDINRGDSTPPTTSGSGLSSTSNIQLDDKQQRLAPTERC